MSAVIDLTTRETVPQICVGPLRAEYTITRSGVTGDWVAVGTVRGLTPPTTSLPWVLVGMGHSATDAVEDLRRQMELHARRVTSG